MINLKETPECCWGAKLPLPGAGSLPASWQSTGASFIAGWDHWADAGELQAGEGVPGHRYRQCWGGAGSKVLEWGLRTAAPLLLLPPAQQSSPRQSDSVSEGKTPISAPGGWQGGSPDRDMPIWCRAGTPLQEKADKAGVSGQGPASPPSLTCRMSPAVSVATAMASRTPRAEFPCLPCDVIRCFPGNPASGADSGKQVGEDLSPPAASCWAHGGLGWLWLSGGDRLAGPRVALSTSRDGLIRQMAR